MKIIFITFFVCFAIGVYAQDLPDYGLNRVRIITSDQSVVAELNPVSVHVATKATLHYYWYSANAIHETQGGYSGRLLDGLYTAYYPNKNLKEQGRFKKGLKDGVWKYWKADGALQSTANWKKGQEIMGEKRSVWQRLPLIHKKAKSADTLNNPHKQVKQ